MIDSSRTSQDSDSVEVGALLGHEKRWVENQKMLEHHGYLLRPRFRPGWVPSWPNTTKDPRACEDYQFNMHRKTIDATRLSDGRTVFIKQILDYKSNEVSIAKFLSSDDKLGDPRNHCVPVLEAFSDPGVKNWTFIVMPLLRPFDDPPFFSVDEVLDFIQQTLEGLSFIHQHGVAHRDASNLNIMFDAKGMHPRGFHPSAQIAEPDLKRLAKPLRRRDVSGVKYYFTDFGISTRFTDPNQARLVTGGECQDREVPELSLLRPYDPFKVDIFTLGNVYKHEFLEKFENLSFLSPLVESMTRRDPTSRPSADEAITLFEKLTAAQAGFRRRWQLKCVGQGRLSRFLADVSSLQRECLLVARRAIKTPWRALAKTNSALRKNWTDPRSFLATSL